MRTSGRGCQVRAGPVVLDADVEELAFDGLMWDVPGVEAAMGPARAMVGRVDEEQMSRIVAAFVTFHLRDRSPRHSEG